jgi:catechol-2,3-dioxygenase
MKFAGICLITKNVSNLANFYTKVLGVKADGDDTHVELITEGGGMTIFSVEGMENLAPQSMQGAVLRLGLKLTMSMPNMIGSTHSGLIL